MSLSRAEIVAKSDLKRGYKNKALKLPLETIAKIEQLALHLANLLTPNRSKPSLQPRRGGAYLT